MSRPAFERDQLHRKDHHPGFLLHGITSKKSEKPQDGIITDWGDVFSKLSYWYGLQFSEIANMPLSTVQAYLQKLEVRQAETKLMLVDVESITILKARDRKKMINRWMKLVQIQEPAKAKKASPAKLKMMGIGVRYVRP